MNQTILPPVADTESETREFNVPIYGTYGEFTLAAEVKVPYMVALMDLKRLTKELKTHEEVSPSLDNSYSLTELFQREIDSKRVREELINGYLKDSGKLKFFNALTIVLLPKDETGKIQSDFEDYQGNDPAVPEPSAGQFDPFFANATWKKSVFGGVQFISTTTANISRLRWDVRRVDAVAVDGQHRLKALKDWMAEKNNELVPVEKPTRVPVIFLLLHGRAGFAHANRAAGLKAIAREIFTDLNKNAREVDLATQIVLDDRSVESLCVRSLVTPGTCLDSPPLLPLTMVRWQEANNRFDQRYFVNSLVHLHSLIEELFDFQAPRKIDKDAALKFIKKIQDTLGTLTSQGKSLQEYYIENYTDESGEAVAPINGIPPSYLQAAVDGFRNRFSSWLLQLLTDFLPYKRVLDYARKENLISGDFGKFLSQPKSHQSVLETELKNRFGDHWRDSVVKAHEDRIQELKGIGRSEDVGGEYWAFKAIFQKAFIKLGKTLFFDAAPSDRDRFGSVDEFLDFFGAVHERGALGVQSKFACGEHRFGIWTFVSVNQGNGKIQVVATAEKRMAALLALTYYTWRYAKTENKTLVIEVEDPTAQIQLKSVIDKLAKPGSTTNWPNAPTYVAEIKNQFILNCEYIDPSCTDKDSKKALTNAATRLHDQLATLLGVN